MPSDIFYMIDILCNEKCTKCSHWKHKSIKKYNIDYVINFVKQIESAREFCIVGGEPLLYSEEIIKCAKLLKQDVRLIIITNGIKATEEFLQNISNYNVHIIFSIDTIDKNFWKSVRGNDSYDIVMKNFNSARKLLNPHQLSVQSVRSKNTLSHIIEVEKMCKDYGIYHSIQDYIDDFGGQWEAMPKEKYNNISCQAYKFNLSIMANGDIKTCFQQEKIAGCENPIGHITESYSEIFNRDYTNFVLNKMKYCNLSCKVLKCNHKTA